VPRLQAASALGQGRLQALWEAELGRAGAVAAQVLLTAADIADRGSYVNARNAFQALFRLGAVPVVNENDVTATEEISFGDNDVLAAQVAILVRARLLVLLTEVEGVYSRAPGKPGATLLATWEGDAAFGTAGPLGRGGMASKVIAAEMAAAAGIPTVVAAGAGASVLPPILAGEPRGTRFPALDGGASAFKLWLRFAKPAVGRLAVDDGARRAVEEQGATLLAVGVSACEGSFDEGDAVELVGPDGVPFAKGIAGASAEELTGRPHGVEAVHRDRLVLY
jgi:glutamate 5-kinase